VKSKHPTQKAAKAEANMTNKSALQKRIHFVLIFFISALALSGLTAIPLPWELKLLMPFVEKISRWGMAFPAVLAWINRINDGLQNGYGQYPFLAYGTDWLAFGHVVIAIAFVGVLRDPLRNIWVVNFGMIACLLVIPWALIFGGIRGIPFFWQLIDMSFGVLGIVPLWLVRRDILRLSGEL
jgi:hypothetical protein